jgi:Fe-S-cluster containining protein
MLSISKYRSLIDKIDGFQGQWAQTPPFELSCREGCDECCRSHVTLFAVEVAAISEALLLAGQPIALKKEPSPDGECPFLRDGRCLIYPVRPIICRTHGYPIIFLDDSGKPNSNICSRNRTAGEISLAVRYVLDLEILNKCLSSINYLYLAEMEERGTIVPSRLDILEIVDFAETHPGI